ncbi:MAG: glutamyl-tRNA reductase, partial [Gemmatimonadetes bacterium]|nr:glutamyl-tRNA reductase [Gemmatimonadota bacterium]
MPLAMVGVSHHTAPVEVRERFAYTPAEAVEALRALRDEARVEEAVLLSTCNRTEVYLYPALDDSKLDAVEAVLALKSGRLAQPVREYLYRRRGADAARHLFRVTAGLDSLVLGEAEIQGQVKEAYRRSSEDLDPPAVGTVLNRLFQTALSVGGQVREETRVNEGSASVASVAVDVAGKIFGDLRGKRVLVLGAGETSELVVRALGRQGVEGVVVANRTYARATSLAERLRGRAVRLERITAALANVDIVVASTAAPHPLITPDTLHEAFPRGVRHPLLVIDIAIPRDVDAAVGAEHNVFLYNVDDLHRILDENLDRRQGAVMEAEAIADEGARDFDAWYRGLAVVPVIRSLREGAERQRQREMERLLSSVEHWSDEERAAVEAFSRRLLNKWLHGPTVRLRDGAAEGRGAEVLEAAHLLLGIDPGRGGAAPDAIQQVLEAEPSVLQQNGQFSLAPEVAAERLAQMDAQAPARFRDLHLRALTLLQDEIERGAAGRGEAYATVVARLAEALLNREPNSLFPLIDQVRRGPPLAQPARHLLDYYEGAALFRTDRYAEALACFARLLADPALAPRLRGRTLNTAAPCFFLTGQVQRALDNFTASLAVWQELHEPAEEAKVLLNMGIVAYELHRYDEAEEHLRLATDLCRSAGALSWHAAAQNELGLVYRDQ